MKIFWFVVLLGLLPACQNEKATRIILVENSTETDLSAWGRKTLSGYGFFAGDLRDLKPSENVFTYTINSPLFSDYAFKKRFISIPSGTKIQYDGKEVFHFPEGTALIKNFYFPADFQKPEQQIRLIETRLLLLVKGVWTPLTYVWNEEQSEAHLELAGRNVPVSWSHYDGSNRQVNYSVPDINQCRSCHLKGESVMPIGPTARQLNSGKSNSQLVMWEEGGYLSGLPAFQDVPVLTSYENEHEPLDARARAWLEVNCAHCHRPDGQAKTSGLYLMASVSSLRALGVGKAPIAAGKGSGGRLFSIVPSRPDESILLYRIESTDPGIMMPEMGRKLVHAEGVALVRKWIQEMAPKN